jgi:signal transduction histidine kinase
VIEPNSISWLALLPGALIAVIGALLLYFGYRWGRSSLDPSLGALERYLRGVASKREESLPELEPEDPAFGATQAAQDLVRSFDQRYGALQHRQIESGAALELLSDRGLMLVDREGTVTLCSVGVARSLGLPLTDIEGVPLAALVEAASWKEFLPQYTSKPDRRRGFSAELAFLQRNQPARPLQVHLIELEPAERGVAVWVEPQPEVDESRVQEQSALALYRTLFESSIDGVLIAADGIVLEANVTAESWWGRGLAGVPIRNLVPAEEMLRFADRAERSRGGDTVSAIRVHLLAADPLRPPREVEAHFRSLAGGEAAAIVLRDPSGAAPPVVDPRVQTSRLGSILEAIGEGVVMFVPKATTDGWRVQLANRCFAEWVGLAPAQLEGQTPAEIGGLWAARTEDPAKLAGFMARVFDHPTQPTTTSFSLSGPPPRRYDALASPVLNRRGELEGVLITVHDISVQADRESRLEADRQALGRSRETLQRSYEELARTHRDLERRSVELDRVNKELQDLERSRTQLVSDVTHELQTPLVSIRGYTQMILEGRLGKVNDEQRRGLEVALRNVDRMVELITNLLALARSESGSPLATEPVEIEAVVEAVIARLEGQARRKNVEVYRRIAPGLRALAERDALTVVLENLVGNAIKFNKGGGRVTIAASAHDPRSLAIEIEDTGIGIPAAERPKVFERFFRGRASAGIPGSGIGLATVSNLVNRHGGKIEVLDNLAGGTTMRVTWPAAHVAPAPSGSTPP